VPQPEATLKCQSITVSVETLRKTLGATACKAFAKIRFRTEVGSITIDNFRLIVSKKGDLFVVPPSHKKDDKFYDDVEVTEDLKVLVQGAVVREYQNESK
jgi:DNA-binding cell septation regulator SpoVG